MTLLRRNIWRLNGAYVIRFAAGLNGSSAKDVPVLTPRTRVWFNLELRSRNYFEPGVVVNIILVTLILTAALLVFPFPRQRAAAARLFDPVFADDARRRVAAFDHFSNAAAGHAGVLLLFDALLHAERLHFPHPQHARRLQYLAYLNPVRYFMEIVRGIFLKGVGISILWPQMAALAVFGVAVLGFSALRFHKRLD